MREKLTLIDLVYDEKGFEMVQAFHKGTEDNLVFCYQNLLDYVNTYGIEEAYSQYKTMKDKGVFDKK